MQKLCCVRTRQHPLPVWSHKFVLSSTSHISTNSHPFFVGIVSLVGTIAHEVTLATVHDLHHCTVAPFLTTPLQWPGATRLPPPLPVLRVTSFTPQVSSSARIGTCRSGSISQGWPNQLADIASWRFDLSNDALLAFLDSVASHTQPWQMLHLLPGWLSRLTTNLQR